MKTIKFKQISLNFFLISLFLFRIPSFYFFPFFQHTLLTSQSLARVLIFLVFVIEHFILNNKNLFIKKNKTLFILILLLFAIQSLSIISARNITAFWLTYKDIIISVMFFLGFYSFRNKTKKIFKILITAFIINTIYQFFLLFNLDLFKQLAYGLFYKKNLDVVLANIYRGRIYMNAYDEIMIPFLFNSTNFVKLMTYFIITFFSFASNFRSRMLMWFCASIGGLLIINKIKFSIKYILFGLIIIISIGFAYIVTTKYLGLSFFDRLSKDSSKINYRSYLSRINQIYYSVNIAKGNILGVGLGNYYDNIGKQQNIFEDNNQRLIANGATEYIHNIFSTILAESGFMSLIIFMFILTFFFINDIKLIREKNGHSLFIVSFWSLFCFGLFNPIVPAAYQILFWGIRGLLVNPTNEPKK